ncbi:DUF2157 domain-containing protein [Aquimarina gracilis]|uniref:DUF2157 domain-containing protein n=1 Tax=Aquimarina gracilis TaxID=874422 RepID=A0ABU5ZTT9_9FLAO|nr:DUF2157 domain-containing protein [Aquimarina gracilis]MEB3345500.1 DUF2157 domain-containing protein [Aquimarina gracilis]
MGSKFNKELKTLVRDKVISPELADKIEQYYATKDIGKPNKLFMIFGVFGALLVGSGIILMLAHNWDDFSRVTKTILAFAPLLIGQFFTGFSILKKKSATWKEASGTFLFFSVGACIALISQIYNIPGDLGAYLLTWTALCFPLMYLLRSHAVALLVVLFSTYYAVEVGLWNYRNSQTPWMYLIFFFGVLPHYFFLLKKKISSNTVAIFNWVLPASIVIALGAFVGKNGDLGFVKYITLFGLLYNIGRLSIFEKLRTLKNGYLIIGSMGTAVSLMIFTFRWIWDEHSDILDYNAQGLYTALFLLVAAITALGYIFGKNGIKGINLFQVAFMIFWFVFFSFSSLEVVAVILMNMLVFALGISAIKIGADKFNFGILNYGLLIISILIVCRFFDTGMSFVLRGILFVLVGAGFFVTNYVMLKKQQKIKKQLKDLQL